MMGREQECEPSSASPQIRWQQGPGGVAGEEDAGGKGNEGWSQGRRMVARMCSAAGVAGW